MNSFHKMTLQYTSQKSPNSLPPKRTETLLYPHLRSFMRFSDSTQFHIPKPNKFANSDSSPFKSNESASDDESPQKPMTPVTTSNYGCPTRSSIDNSPIKQYDNSPFEQIIKTPQTDISIDRSRHPSQNQSTSLPPLIDRTTKTHYNLRHQPSIDYKFLYHKPNFTDNQSL